MTNKPMTPKPKKRVEIEKEEYYCTSGCGCPYPYGDGSHEFDCVWKRISPTPESLESVLKEFELYFPEISSQQINKRLNKELKEFIKKTHSLGIQEGLKQARGKIPELETRDSPEGSPERKIGYNEAIYKMRRNFDDLTQSLTEEKR